MERLSQTAVRVAFQGERGAFSEEAAIRLLGEDVVLVPRTTFADLFQSLHQGVADLIIAPVENTISGVIEPSRRLLESSGLLVVAEVSLRVTQNLIVSPGTQFQQIRSVQSHPVALAQCTQFFAAHPHLLPVEAEDTAGSVAEVMRLGDPTRAAIAGKRAAQFYGATVLKEQIQDTDDNFTRFVLLKRLGAAIHVNNNKLEEVTQS